MPTFPVLYALTLYSTFQGPDVQLDGSDAEETDSPSARNASTTAQTSNGDIVLAAEKIAASLASKLAPNEVVRSGGEQDSVQLVRM